ncbi:hypothetical protein TanjilG_00122 [Lupinus angustifolius]|uniref:Uncharacterized protein n=1 Tax=Lupinus angustifolius TaxID=3871 RepID=A0A1J7GW35_LUPAN|nr:PREDICTED: uncharacterized protein LOC109357554 [Lupinus angustifolius]XP_019457111.1 PREDICTED: uncharacterized protein LOC109357554 [Lupinus angustifolius]OIW04686.1 hypothetical protein TanjilG_00122 [Lupinus angustifolius]
MEDVITEAAPPSRFLDEDLNNFTLPSPFLPSPFFLFSHSQSQSQSLKPTTFIISLTFPSPSIPPIASLILPEIPFSTASLHPSPPSAAVTLHSLSPHTLFASVNSPISPDRAHAVARVLIGDRIVPDSVLILDSIRPRNYRGRLSSDEAVAFRLESLAERKRGKGEKMLEGLEYYPSGSVVDGLAAAVLARCQVLGIRAGLCVSWPQFDASVSALLKGVLRNGALRGLDLDLIFSDEVLQSGKGRSKDHGFQSDLYI